MVIDMKNVNLTEEEIEMLQCVICNQQFELRAKIENLKGHNITGINTNVINKERERLKSLEEIYKKLYEISK